MLVSVVQMWAEGVDEEGVKEADEEEEEVGVVMGEGCARTTGRKDVGGRVMHGLNSLSICGHVSSSSSSTSW